MYFTNQYQKRVVARENIPKQNGGISPVLSLSPRYLQYLVVKHEKNKEEMAKELAEKPVVVQPKKMKWGEPTWFLFHTLAQKIKDDSFPTKRLELLNIINTICMNLPCPDCAKHATQYMAGINFNTIQTKEHLKIMLFNFHNAVNARKGVPLFKYDDLDEKYDKANFIPIINNFMVHFEDKHKSIRMIADDLHRVRVSSFLKTWFTKNLNHFIGFE